MFMLWLFGNFSHMVYVYPFWYVIALRKAVNPDSKLNYLKTRKSEYIDGVDDSRSPSDERSGNNLICLI
jgi:hypothetical protein